MDKDQEINLQCGSGYRSNIAASFFKEAGFTNLKSLAGGKIGEVYGVYDETAGVDVRGRFLINPDGIVQGFEVLTPSGWRPGKNTLKPEPDLVGKVLEVWSVDKAFD